MITGESTDMEIERRSEGNQFPESLDGVLNEMQSLDSAENGRIWLDACIYTQAIVSGDSPSIASS